MSRRSSSVAPISSTTVPKSVTISNNNQLNTIPANTTINNAMFAAPDILVTSGDYSPSSFNDEGDPIGGNVKIFLILILRFFEILNKGISFTLLTQIPKVQLSF